MTSTMDALLNVPMFRDLDTKTLRRVETIARERSFAAGDVIVKEGDEGVGFFLITEGNVEVTKDGKELIRLGASEFFGEMALLDNFRRSATVRALTPTKTLAMLRSDFIAELRANADLAVEMLVLMSRRLREADSRLADG